MKDYIICGLSHIGMVTDDPDKAAQFYMDNLGFRPWYRKETPKQVCTMIEQGGLVLEFAGKGANPTTGAIYHFALEVCHLEGLVAELKEKGVIPKDAEIFYNPDFLPSGMKCIVIDGPCGEHIELHENNANRE